MTEEIKELFEAMRNDLGVMAEHSDSDAALMEELTTADAEIIETYKAMYL